jgi:glyoxylase-like metal-dependent hydrolase (beta-lactamase superfamily II)
MAITPTRRAFLKTSAAAAGILLHSGAMRGLLAQQTAPPQPSQDSTAPPNLIQTYHAAGATTPVKSTKLTDTVFLLQGVGGNMVVHIGPDGKLLIDSSVATAATHIREVLDKLDPHPLKLLINTHWHFDHTDGNAAMHDAGAFIIAQENTRLRLSTPQTMKLLNITFPPSPTSGLPQETFVDREKLFFDNDELHLVHTPNAHTDSDIYIYFVNANVIHTGDLWFNGMYPLIDDSSGGTVNGMIRGVDEVIAIADDKTRIVPGHGQLGDKAALVNYREMLTTIANRIEKLKIAGQTLAQVIAQKPTSDLDQIWAKGMMKPDMFVTVVYNTL